MSINCEEFEYTNIILILTFLFSFVLFQFVKTAKKNDNNGVKSKNAKALKYVESYKKENLEYFLSN